MNTLFTFHQNKGSLRFLLAILLFLSIQTVQAQAPTITSFSPTSAAVGATVTITGTNFSATAANNIVYFGAVKATVTAATATTLTVTVPVGASYKPITVAVAGNLSLGISPTPFVTTFTGGGAITSGSFSSTAVVLTYGSFTTKGIAAGDIDGDGKVDLLSANSATTNFSLFRNTSTPGTLSFAAPANTTWPGNPNKIRLADLNADGKLEIMGVSSTLSNLTYWQNNSTPGTVSLGTRQNMPVSGTNLISLATADFDNDGKMDAVTLGNTSNTINVLKNNTALATVIGFQTGLSDVYTTGTNSIDVSTADFNLDGKQDIVVSGWGTPASIAVYPNTTTAGTISFGAKINLTVTGATNPSVIAVGDIDGDGKMDVVVNERVGGAILSVYRNTSVVAGTISFAARQTIPGVQFQAQSVDLGDLDGDGKIDIAAGFNAGIDLLKNTSTVGTISFSAAVRFDAALGFEEVVIGDFDGDGRNDFAGVSNSVVGAIYVYRNIMAPPTVTSFTPTRAVAGTTVTITGTNFLGATAVSFGGVAATSFVVVNSTTITAVVGNGASGNVAVTTPFGTGTAADFIYSLPPKITSFSPAQGAVGTTVTITGTDFGATPAENIVYFGATRATVTAASLTSLTVTVPVGATYKPISVWVSPLKLTAQSNQSFIVTYPSFTTNLTAFSFAPKVDITGGNNMFQTVLMDMDGDGKADMLTSSGPENSFATNRNTSTIGTISFAARSTYATVTSGQPFGIDAGDLNGDGKPDVVVANVNTAQLSVALNTTTTVGTITYGTRADFLVATGAGTRTIKLADINGDGKLDMVCTNPNANSMSVFRNTTPLSGTLSFAAPVSVATGSNPSSLDVGDFDGDGKIDVVVGCAGTGTLNLFQNTSTLSTISFAAPVVNPASVGSIAVGDLNNDNLLDLIVSSGSQISYFQNASTNGNISFFAIGSVSKATNGAVISDLNGDGKPDMAASGVSIMTVASNQSLTGDDIVFSSNTDFSALSNAYATVVGDIDGDGKNDVVSTNRALTGFISIFRNTNSAPLPPVVSSFTPKTASSGTTITITGTNFTGATGVSFGGIIASSFSVVNANTITAVVNTTGFSGDVAVTNPLGTSSLPGFTWINNVLDVQSCGGSPVFITSNLTGLSYQWQIDTGTGYTNISAANADYSGVNTVTLTINNAPSTWYGYKYRCIVGTSTPSNVYVLKFVAHWIGFYTSAVNISWENTANWNCGKIPDANTDVFIPAGSLTINSAAQCRSITARPSSIVTVTSGNSLKVNH
ncbi:MAG: beta strand repeat-containing protein [Ferruginibacter sp.]